MPPKDFNLNEALSGAKLRTRDGFPVTIYTFARRFPAYPIVGVINYPDHDFVTTWTPQGRATKLHRVHGNDLMICTDETPEPEASNSGD